MTEERRNHYEKHINFYKEMLSDAQKRLMLARQDVKEQEIQYVEGATREELKLLTMAGLLETEEKWRKIADRYQRKLTEWQKMFYDEWEERI